MRLAVRTCVLAMCAFATSLGIARADLAPKWSDDDLARFSQAIVTGRVIDVATGKDIVTDAIHTYVTVAVTEVLKGDIPERSIVVKQLGGRLGEDRLVIFGQPDFVRGEEVLLFLNVRPRDRTLTTTAMWQGKWTMGRDADTGEAIATRLNGDGTSRGVFRGESERRAASTLMSRLRAAGRLPQDGAAAASKKFVRHERPVERGDADRPIARRETP